MDQLKELFEFLELDPSIYEFESALDAPVKGSSTYGQDEGGWTGNLLKREKASVPSRDGRIGLLHVTIDSTGSQDRSLEPLDIRQCPHIRRLCHGYAAGIGAFQNR